MTNAFLPTTNRSWPHRLACALVCATFPLIWVGGLVTTYDAGMAVPDWPNTYGYNLFLYPWQTWMAGPWDLFIEHGHRLLGAVVGLITIGFVASVFLSDDRRWMKFAALAALAAVILQGVLGGQRVLLDSRMLALVHGCFGPAFFALCVGLAAATSPWWRQAPTARLTEEQTAGIRRVGRLALMTLGLAYFQLLLGAQLRHHSAAGSPGHFQGVVVFHLLVAAALLAHAGMLSVRGWRLRHTACKIAIPAMVLLPLLLLQVSLGGGAWVFKYGWPAWFGGYPWAQGHVNVNESLPEVLVTTGHVAIGSLILATSLLAAVRAFRLSPAIAERTSFQTRSLEAAR